MSFVEWTIGFRLIFPWGLVRICRLDRHKQLVSRGDIAYKVSALHNNIDKAPIKQTATTNKDEKS
jgi:hypothetical protein